MSEIKDFFDDEELTELADEIRKDLLTQPDLQLKPNDSFAIAFKLKLDLVKDNSQNEQTKHEPYPSWSYLSLSNTEDHSHYIVTPHTPEAITPYTPTHLINIDSFPLIPKTSINVAYSWVRNNQSNPPKLLSFNTPSLQVEASSNISIITDSTIISPINHNQKTFMLPMSGLNATKSNQKDIKHNKYPSVLITSPILIDNEGKNNNTQEYALSVGNNDEENIEYGIECDDGFIFVNPDQ
eukprot:364042_1